MIAHQDDQDAFALGALFEEEQAHADTSVPVNLVSPNWASSGEAKLLQALRVEGLTTTATERTGMGHTRARHQHATWAEEAKSLFGSKRRRLLQWGTAAVAAAGLVMALSVSLFSSGNEEAIQFQVAEGPLRTSGHVESPASAQVLTFSDGSRLTLAAASRLRVRSTDADGAEIVVERGRVDSAVVHDDQTQWSVFAGPYEVKVIGTRFSTEWDPKQQSISVVLHEGTVQILGAGIEGNVELRPGQRFDAGGSTKWTVSPHKSAAAPLVDPSDLPDESPPEAEPSAPLPGKAPSAVQHASWAKWLAQGEFQRVINAAKSRGLNSCLQSCGSSELRALADAARYTGDIELARQGLNRLREHGPSERARAGYLLGSLAEARGQAANAMKWYAQYISEAPGGPLISEARAGRMRCLVALGQKKAAQNAARQYLQLHPRGVGAKTARSLLQQR